MLMVLTAGYKLHCRNSLDGPECLRVWRTQGCRPPLMTRPSNGVVQRRPHPMPGTIALDGFGQRDEEFRDRNERYVLAAAAVYSGRKSVSLMRGLALSGR